MTKKSSVWDKSLVPFRPHTIAQGEVLHAYNRLQDTFFSVLYAGLALERPEGFSRKPTLYSHVLAVWNVISNDRMQRELSITVLETLPTELRIKEGIERLKWAKDKINKLVDYRNLIAHTPFTFMPVNIHGVTILAPKIGGMGTKPQQTKRLSGIKDLRFWKSLRNDFLNLNEYVDGVNRQIWLREFEREQGRPVVGAHRSWPGKPRLRCLRLIAAIEQAQTKAKPIRPHHARQRPSRR